MEWADAITWRAVLGSEAAPTDDRIRSWLYHIHVVQHAFLQAWRGETLVIPTPSDFSDLPSLASWGRSGHAGIQVWLATAQPERVSQPLRVPWAAEVEQAWQRSIAEPTVGQSAVQVALHTTHHRGQVSARLRELGGEPQHIDFIVWVWWGQPAPDWSFLEP
jgi:uncharacterized damage-inducible protein DinB